MKSVSLLRFLSIFAMLSGIPVSPSQASPLNGSSVRMCEYIPGVSVPAQMPDEVMNAATPTPFPTATLPAPTNVDSDTTERQLETFDGLWDAVDDNYVYPDFNGHDWDDIGEQYEALIEDGVSDEDFAVLMQALLNELGDNHSYFQSAEQVAEDEEALARGVDFVGVGALFLPLQDPSQATVITVFPDSPAEAAGLLPHDTILAVDGQSVRDEHGRSRTLGPEGSDVTLTVQRPNEAPFDVTLTRGRVTGSLPINYCLVPNTRIGYIFLPTFLSETIDDQTRDALEQLTADGSLDGLVLDNRMNGGGLGSVAEAVMSLFTSGVQGYYVSREDRDALDLEAEDIGGSQTVPLVVLVGADTVSYGEIVSGVLRLSGRAQIIGDPTLGNVEQLRRYDFDDGSRAWIASATFEPRGEANGIWEETGIIPDVIVPTRWNLFTEATDPALAAAVELLMDE